MDFAKTILGKPLSGGKKLNYTFNSELWYKINFSTKELYVPKVQTLRSNVAELEKFIEALQNFDAMDLNNFSGYNWDGSWIENHTTSTIGYLRGYRGENPLDVAVDIETRHVGYNDNAVLAIGFCWEQVDTGLKVATIRAEDFETPFLNRLFAKKNLNFIWHNGKFDTSRLKYLLDVDARVDDDTMLMHYIGINEKKGTHGLKQLGQVYLQAPPWDDELDAFKKKWCKENGVKLRDFTYDMIPVSTLIPYLKRDVIATYRLCKLFRETMRPNSVWMYKKLVEASNTYRRIELNGVELNRSHLVELKKKLKAEADEADKIVQEIIKKYWDPIQYCHDTGASMTKSVHEFSMKSPKKLKWLLSKLVGFQVKSTDKAAIEELTEHMEKVKDEAGKQFLEALSKTRKANKYYDTYCLGLEGLCCEDGRVRCTYNLHGTETGRLSSTDPNMQNIPRNSLVKNLITCKEGNILVQLDYSQAELRVLTALSGDPYLLHIYEGGHDLHDMMATKMFGPDFTKEQRVITKSLNFGIAYGRGPANIAQTFKISMAEASKVVNDWFAVVPEVEKFIKKKRQEPFKGETCKTPFGRERHFVITDENKYHVSNEAINFPIQSIASDLTLLSVLELQRWIDSPELELDDKVKIVATVHDSIIIECKNEPELIDFVVRTGAEIMATQPDKYNIGIIKVPFRADAEVGFTWGAVKPYEASK